MIDFTDEEKSFLIKKLKGDHIWYSQMSNEYGDIFGKEVPKIASILFKLGQHPFKTKLEENLKP